MTAMREKKGGKRSGDEILIRFGEMGRMERMKMKFGSEFDGVYI